MPPRPNELSSFMKFAAVPFALALSIAAPSAQDAQEKKPVPKNSVRVSIPGCSRGYVFTVGPRTVDQPGSVNVPEGMHLRMNGPKDLIKEIKAHEGSMIELTGLMKKSQYDPRGVAIGGGIRVSPGPAPGGSGMGPGAPVSDQPQIDVEGWRPATGDCPAR
jgi:hypothetical protein